MCIAASVALGADIIVKAPGPDGVKTVMLTTNDASLVHFDWEAVNGGGVYDISGRLVDDSVVLLESTWQIDDDIRMDKTSKTVVPTKKLPREVTVGSTNIEILFADNEDNKKSQQSGAGYPPQGVGSPDP